MLVRDRMIRRLITVDAGRPVRDAHRLLIRHRLRQLPVLRDGQLVGIISHRDLRAARPSIRTVEQAMTANPVTIGPDTAIDEAAQVLRTYKVGGLPVVERHCLVGIITVADVLDAFVALCGIETGTFHLIVSGRGGRKAASARQAIERTRAEVLWMFSEGRRLQMRVKVKRPDAVVSALEAAGFAVERIAAPRRVGRPARARRALLP